MGLATLRRHRELLVAGLKPKPDDMAKAVSNAHVEHSVSKPAVKPSAPESKPAVAPAPAPEAESKPPVPATPAPAAKAKSSSK